MTKFIDLTGQKFGKLTVIKRAENNNRGQTQWLCQCECGNKKIILGNNLKNGTTKSCGCIQKEHRLKGFNKTHGNTNTRLYRAWVHIKSRCYNIKVKDYKNYGGRGIIMCDEWLNDFMSFYNWAMANGYQDNLTIDRIDVNGNYEPNNCRWVDMKTQQNNRTNNNIICINGERKTLSNWLEYFNLRKDTYYRRIKAGWDTQKALITKTRKKQK